MGAQIMSLTDKIIPILDIEIRISVVNNFTIYKKVSIFNDACFFIFFQNSPYFLHKY